MILKTKNDIPNNITHLQFSDIYNQMCQKFLSYFLTHLIFGLNYNQIIKKDVLPNSLTNLTFSVNYSNEKLYKIKLNYLSNNIKNLNNYEINKYNLPNTIVLKK